MLVLAATCILVLTYSPFSAIVLLVAALRDSDRGFTRKFALGATYVAGFTLGTLAIYSLNLAFHAYIGVRIAAWRLPHPLRGIGDLLVNLHAYGTFWTRLSRVYWPSIACGAAATGILLVAQATRNKTVNVLLATAPVCVASSLASRSSPASTFPPVVPCGCGSRFACRVGCSQPDRRYYLYVGHALLLVLAIVGAISWWTLYRQKQPTAAYRTQLAAQIHRYETSREISRVISMDNPPRIAGLRGLYAKEPLPEFITLMHTHVSACNPARSQFASCCNNMSASTHTN